MGLSVRDLVAELNAQVPLLQKMSLLLSYKDRQVRGGRDIYVFARVGSVREQQLRRLSLFMNQVTVNVLTLGRNHFQEIDCNIWSGCGV